MKYVYCCCERSGLETSIEFNRKRGRVPCFFLVASDFNRFLGRVEGCARSTSNLKRRETLSVQNGN